MGKKKTTKHSKKNKKDKKNSPTQIISEEYFYGPQTYEKYLFLATFIGGIIFMFIYLFGLIWHLISY